MRNYCGVISSNALNYQVILEQSFIEFLTGQGASEKTRNNYRSDLRHFVGWTMLTIISTGLPNPTTHLDFVHLISPDLLHNYKLYMVENTIPTATINRRLSTIRMFFRCCLTHGWITHSPAETLINIRDDHKNNAPLSAILTHWKQDLEKEGASKSTIKNYLTDVRKFLEWIPISDAQIGTSGQ